MTGIKMGLLWRLFPMIWDSIAFNLAEVWSIPKYNARLNATGKHKQNQLSTGECSPVEQRLTYVKTLTRFGGVTESYNNSSTLTSVVARPVNYCNTRRSMFDMTITHEYMPLLGTSRDPANCESKCVRSGELLKSGAAQLNAYSNTWRTTCNHWSIGNLTIPYLWPM